MYINLIKTSQYLKNFCDHNILQSAADSVAAHNLNANKKKKINTDTAGILRGVWDVCRNKIYYYIIRIETNVWTTAYSQLVYLL